MRDIRWNWLEVRAVFTVSFGKTSEVSEKNGQLYNWMEAGNFLIEKVYKKHNFIIKNFNCVVVVHLFKIDFPFIPIGRKSS